MSQREGEQRAYPCNRTDLGTTHPAGPLCACCAGTCPLIASFRCKVLPTAPGFAGLLEKQANVSRVEQGCQLKQTPTTPRVLFRRPPSHSNAQHLPHTPIVWSLAAETTRSKRVAFGDAHGPLGWTRLRTLQSCIPDETCKASLPEAKD